VFLRSAWRKSILLVIRNSKKYILDTHDHPVLDPVWRLYERAIQTRLAILRTLLEWDDSIPSFEEVHRESHESQSLPRRPRRWRLQYEARPASAGLFARRRHATSDAV